MANAAVTSVPFAVRTVVTPAISVAFQILPSSALLSSALVPPEPPEEHPELTRTARAMTPTPAIIRTKREEMRLTVDLRATWPGTAPCRDDVGRTIPKAMMMRRGLTRW